MIQLEPGEQLDTMEKILLTTGMINSMALSWDKLMQFRKFSGMNELIEDDKENDLANYYRYERTEKEKWFAEFGKRLYDMYEEIANVISGVDAQSDVLVAITEPFFHAIHDQIAES